MVFTSNGFSDFFSNLGNGITGVWNWTTDPIGSLLTVVAEAVMWLFTSVFTFFLGIIQPNFAEEGWIEAYKGTFGLALVLWAFLMLISLANMAWGRIPRRKGFEIMTSRSVLFLVGSSFAPLLLGRFT